MRLLFVSHSLPPADRPLANLGGMQRVALKLHEALDARPASAAFSYDHCLLRCSWDVIHRKVPFFLLRTAWRIVRKARAGQVDVVLFSSMVTASLAVLLQGVLRRHGVQSAAIVHGLDVTTPFPPYQWFVPKVFNALDAVLPVSRATGAACLERGLSEEKLHVVPNGIDLNRFPPPAPPAEMRAHLTQAMGHAAHPLPDDALLLCSVGRQVKRKGTAWFVRHVMPRLPNNVHYWIAGDGPQDDAIDAAIQAHDLHPQVRRLGRISNENLTRLYRGADLFVMPNVPVPGDMEGFGIVMLEAGQNGCPVVAARLEGIQDVIAEDVNGHLVAPKDAEAFEAAILRYHRQPERLRAASERAVRYTREHFGWAAVAERYLKTLRSL
ncbi:glycosyltransferase family 4 protein [Salisaeta longa]|uniref:glycosyltransferase family 4 protein n=1 Tax=Salisaeta longa TaxID=503170 RepID=UPI0006871C52|nr:glycosyltransferase family 4 protein [Salisaeta longa]